MKHHVIDDIVSVEKLRLALRSIAKAAEMNLCMIDLMGNVIISPTNDSPFCNAARENPEVKNMCMRCASHAALECARERRTYIYKCPYGLIDFAIPVFYKDEFLGAICGGQIKSENGDTYVDFAYNAEMPDAELQPVYDNLNNINAERLLEVSRLLFRLTQYLTHFGILIDIENNAEKQPLNLYKLRPAIIYIERNYNRPVSLKDLAALCFVSESYFSRLFKSVTKKNVSKYILDMRINKAKELLASGRMKISAVASEVGYDDPAYFIRKFKQATGITPTEYRAMYSECCCGENAVGVPESAPTPSPKNSASDGL